MRLIFIFLRTYRLQSAITLVALMFAGLIEGFGLSMLLPLLGLAGEINGGTSGTAVKAADSTLSQIINDVFGTIGVTPTIGMLLIAFVACMTLKAFLALAANRRVGYMVARVATDLRLELIRALFVTRWEYFIRQPVGSLTNSIANEVSKSSKAYLYAITMLAAVLHAIIYAMIVLLVSWKAAIVALVAGVVILFMVRRYIKKSKRAGKLHTSILQSLMSYLTDSLIMIKPLKTMAREHLADAALQKKTENLRKAIKKQIFAKHALAAAQEPLTVGFTAAGLYGVLVIWKMPLASVLVMVYMLSKLLKKLQKIQSLYQQVVTAENAYWSYQDKLHRALEEKESLTGSQQPSLNQSIRLERVCFAYADRWILKDAHFDFPAKAFTAIVGPSGEGKTTVIDLITGLLKPQQGEILIDGVPLAKLDLMRWRQMIGYVPQESLLLHDTVFINVTLGDKTLNAEDTENALRAAGAWNFVQELPEGMDTVVGERGHKLSGGQRQRIAIARALVHHPELLILDEATTALDPDNENAICDTLRNLKGKHTILAISHQPAILKAAERAYRLEGGIAILMPDLVTQGTEDIKPSAATA
jgi:ATP-binding cassette subfamily C protein